MKYLITGGCGFIGFHLAKELLENGEEVIIVDNFNDYYDPKIKRDRAAELMGAIIEEIDILDFSALEIIFTKYNIDRVIHLAAYPGVYFSSVHPELYIKNNIEGTFNIFEISRRQGIKNIVFASSSTVYKGLKPPFEEDCLLSNQMSVYGYTKRAGELLAENYVNNYQMNIVALRLFSVYGTHGRPDLIFNIIPEALINNHELIVFGDGHQKRDWTNVKDVVTAIKLASARFAGFEVFNIGASKSNSLLKMIKTLAAELNATPIIKYQARRDLDMEITHADISRARAVLDWEPMINFRDGLAELAAWHLNRKNKL